MFQPKTVNRIVSLLVVSLAASCAVENHERRKLLNYLDANWAPSSTSGRWLASPIALPVGVLAGATDAVVLHPSSQIDDAWVDTVDVVWDFGASTDFRTVLLTPLSAVATPVVFVATWSWRAVFDVRDSANEVASAAAESPAVGSPAVEPLGEGK